MFSAVVVSFALAATAASQVWDQPRSLGVPVAVCPLAVAGDVDALVSCPGWETRPCRERDEKGNPRRSSTIKREFLIRYGYPKGRRGFVLDHLFPLVPKCDDGPVGCDVPWNIQFQNTADGKAKDKWERDVCAPDKDEEAEE